MDIKRLKKLREQKKLTQAETARGLGFSNQRYNHYETGKREPDNAMLLLIAEFFGVTADYLLGNDENPSLVVPEELRDVNVAFHRGEFEDLTQDEIDALATIAKTLKAQRKL